MAVVITPVAIGREAMRLVHATHAAAATGSPVDLHGTVAMSLLGAVFAFLAGLVALKWLSNWLENGRWYLLEFIAWWRVEWCSAFTPRAIEHSLYIRCATIPCQPRIESPLVRYSGEGLSCGLDGSRMAVRRFCLNICSPPSRTCCLSLVASVSFTSTR